MWIRTITPYHHKPSASRNKRALRRKIARTFQEGTIEDISKLFDTIAKTKNNG